MEQSLKELLSAAVGDRYTIQREIGRGGMGTVFEALDTRHGRQVAIKVVATSFEDETAGTRFRREIQIAASLTHPNIVPLFDSGAGPGVGYFVMPLFTGKTLRTMLDQTRTLPVHAALEIAIEVADALAYAHEQGIVHRDIKPENLLFQGTRALISDFGIAIARERAQEKPAPAARLTVPGRSMGTPKYMSPEQLSDEEQVDGRTDQFALALVFYEMVSGKRAFSAETPQEEFTNKLMGETEALSAVLPAISPKVDAAIMRALAVRPPDRFPDMRAFHTALAKARDALGAANATTASVQTMRLPVRRPPRGKRIALIVVAAAIVVATFFGVRAQLAWAGLDERALAVFPLRAAVQDLREWGEGLPDLLATTLDGTPGLRVADPWSLWASLRPQRGAPARGPDVDEGRNLARRAGVGRFVLGSMVRDGARIDVTFRFYRVRGNAEPVTIHESAPEDSLTPLALRVAVQVMGWLGDSTPPGGAGAKYATSSPQAMKSYLAARAALRRGMIDSAERAVDHAMALDSSFALAFLEASSIKTWAQFYRSQAYNGLLELVLHADSLSGTMSERNRLRTQMQRALIETRGTAAAELGDRLVHLDSTDFEAWSSLAYTHLVHSWQYGRGLPDMISSADHAAALDPSNALAWYRRAWIAAARNDTADARVQLGRMRLVDTASDIVRGAADALHALMLKDAEAATLLDSVTRRQPTEWISALRFLRVARPDLVMHALELLPGRAAPGGSAQLATQSAQLMRVSVGQIAATDSVVRAGVFSAQPAAAARLQSLIVAAALNGIVAPDVARSAASALERYTPLDSLTLLFFSPRQAWQNAWIIAAYEAAFGDTAKSRRWRTPLATIKTTGLTLREFPQALAADIDSRLALRRGDTAAALTFASRALTQWDIHTENTYESHPEPVIRFRVALLLAATGRADSAAKMFASLTPPTTWLGLMTARSWYEMGRLAEAASDCRAAAPNYALARRVYELGGAEVNAWRDRAREGEKRCGR